MPVPAKAGKQHVRGGCRPPVRLRLRLRRELDPPGEGFTLPPPEAAPPHRIPAVQKEGVAELLETGFQARIEAVGRPISAAAGVSGVPGRRRPRRWRAKGGGSSHAFGRATECPSALGRWSALPGRLLPASCPVPRTGHRDMLLWRRRWPAQALNTAFEEGGSPRSARSSKRPAARPGRGPAAEIAL